MKRDRSALGKWGEAVAARFLVARDVVVVGRNVTSDLGEVDIIADVEGELTAVEVRTARRRDLAPDLISLAKERQLRRVAAGLDPPIFRIDLVTVVVDNDGVRIRWARRV